MIKQQILEELQDARVAFHNLLDSLSAEDFREQSLNPGWTNGEIVAQMTFGFIIVNVLLPMGRAGRENFSPANGSGKSTTGHIFLF